MWLYILRYWSLQKYYLISTVSSFCKLCLTYRTTNAVLTQTLRCPKGEIEVLKTALQTPSSKGEQRHFSHFLCTHIGEQFPIVPCVCPSWAPHLQLLPYRNVRRHITSKCSQSMTTDYYLTWPWYSLSVSRPDSISIL